jgi:hypothetical protein
VNNQEIAEKIVEEVYGTRTVVRRETTTESQRMSGARRCSRFGTGGAEESARKKREEATEMATSWPRSM